MEFRPRTLGFMECFAKQQSSGLFCKTQGSQSKYPELNK